MGYLDTFDMELLASATGANATTIAKSNTPEEQQVLATILHQFLMDGNRNLWDLNEDFKHFTVLVVIPGTYMTNVAYGHVIGAAGIGKFSLVVNKIMALFRKGGGGLVPEQAIFLP